MEHRRVLHSPVCSPVRVSPEVHGLCQRQGSSGREGEGLGGQFSAESRMQRQSTGEGEARKEEFEKVTCGYMQCIPQFPNPNNASLPFPLLDVTPENLRSEAACRVAQRDADRFRQRPSHAFAREIGCFRLFSRALVCVSAWTIETASCRSSPGPTTALRWLGTADLGRGDRSVGPRSGLIGGPGGPVAVARASGKPVKATEQNSETH